MPLPWNTQGYNRYSYANNNPLVYVDPDGNFFFVPILIAAAIGAGTSAAIYSVSAAANGNWSWGGFFKSATVGAVAGGIGGALSGAFTSWGMVGGGIAKGAITGFVTGGVNSALNGTNVLNGALSGALSGGIIGGAMGALERLSIRNSDFDLPADQNTGEYFRSEDELDQFIDDKIGSVSRIQSDFHTDISLASENNLPGRSYVFKDNLMYKLDENGLLQLKGGSTTASGGWFTSLKSRIYISPGIKGLYYSGTNVSQMAINHEILHAYHLTLGLSNSIYNRYSERATSAYSLAYSKTYNMSTLIPSYRSAIGNYPGIYSWRNLIGILNLGIR